MDRSDQEHGTTPEATTTVTAEQPGDDWIAIRYNTMANRDALNKNAKTGFLQSNRRHYAISMFTRPGMTAIEIAIDVARHTRQVSGRMRATRLGDLRRAGFEPIDYNPTTGHIDIRLPHAPDDDLWDRLLAVMWPPQSIPFVTLDE